MPSFSKGADPFDPNDEPRKTRRPRLQYRHVLARPMAPHLGMPQTRYLIERTRSSGATKHHDDLIDHEDFGDGVIALRERPAYSRASSSTFYEPNIGSGRERPAISRASSSTHIVTIRERPKCLRANSSTLHNQPVAYCRHRLGPQRQGRALDRSGDNSYAIVKSANPNDRDTFWLPSDEDDIIRGRARPPSRPRSLASSFCYSEFDELDDECCVRRELPRSALSGLAMAYDLESRLRHVRQTLMLYVDFNRSTGAMFVVGTHNEFYKTLFSALAAVHDIFVPLTLWAADRGKKEGEHQTRRLLYTADKIIKQWNTFSQRILTESDETLFLHNEDRESARQAYKRRWYEWMGFVDNALRALSKENVREDHEGTESLEKHLIHKWRREGQLTFHELQKKGGFKWGMRV